MGGYCVVGEAGVRETRRGTGGSSVSCLEVKIEERTGNVGKRGLVVPVKYGFIKS